MFLAIFLVFIVSWGVAQYGLLYPNTELSPWLIRDILILPYWQMYADLHKDSVIQAPPYEMGEEDSCTNDPELYSNYTKIRCPDKRTNWIVLLLLMGYLLLTNLLLFNLLIAIFAKTFDEIEGMS